MHSSTLRRSFIALAALALTVSRPAQAEVIDSTFVSGFGSWTNATSNWYPRQEPNNVGGKLFNVRLPFIQTAFLDKDVTISSLTLQSQAVLRVDGAALTVLGTTTNDADIGRDDEDDHGIVLDNGATLKTGSLASFSAGTLTGGYRLFGITSGKYTTLQFNGADIRKLSGGLVSLEGPFTRILDENGLDALRNLAEVGAGSRFNINDRSFVTSGDFKNDGTLNVGILAAGDFIAGPSLLSISGKLTNFDATTKTLQNGNYRVSSYTSDSDAILRFPGADIVNNGGLIYLEGAHARIVDELGNDAFRHFAHNLAGASFEAREGFTTAGDFTNDGTLSGGAHAGKGFKVTGKLTNFAIGTRTLTGGTYILSAEGALQAPGIDIVHNAASLVIESNKHTIVDENGNDGLRNFADNTATGSLELDPSAQLDAIGNFNNAGNVFIDGFPGSHGVLNLPAGTQYLQTSGETVVDGTLVAETISIQGGVLRSNDNGWLWGNVNLGDAILAAGYNRTEVTGNLTLSPQSRFHATIAGSDHTELDARGATTTINGTLEVSTVGDVRPPNSAVFAVLVSSQPISGTFTNVANGERLLTTDGTGSFIVEYDSDAVLLKDYLAVPPPAQLLNISTRAQVLTGDNAVIAGFIVGGSIPKKIGMRGIGPSLSRFGLSNALQDPTLKLVDSKGTEVAFNDNWADIQKTEIEQAGLAPDDSREAALIATLNPDSYTVVLRGANDATGVGVVEVYDLNATSKSKVANISTRAHVGDSSNVLIGGFIAGGDGPGNAEVIVRAQGPELERYSVKDYLPDPMLELRDANGGLIAANDDRPNFAVLNPEDPRSSILRAAVPPGAYTAIVRGKNGAQGVATVEVYDLNE